MASPLSSARQHMARVEKIRKAAARGLLTAWDATVIPARIRDSWAETIPTAVEGLSLALTEAATEGVDYGATALAVQGDYVAPRAFVNPAAFGTGFAASGAPLATVLAAPTRLALNQIKAGAAPSAALAQARGLLAGIARTQVADTARIAAQVDVAVRPSVSYIRMVEADACSRCIVLAGKRFRWNAGFLRHPRCRCVHVMATAKALEGARAEGYLEDPYDVFERMSEQEQDRIWGPHNAQAIRDGADIYRVTNARRGANGLLTAEGTSRRGFAHELRGKRLTPEGIYRTAGSRERALELLEQHGYVLPGGQEPGGSIRGWDYEGFGQMGRGGTRRGATDAVLEARRTGIRQPGDIYTATAAERRLIDAQLRWDAVREGRNPFSSAPLTPKIAAQVETDYRRWLNSRGQIFTQ